ncbi:MAG: glycosyltransferase [Acidimicrobiia bacterium]
MGVIIAWLSPGTVAHDFCRSLANVIAAEPDRIAGQIPLPSGPNLSASRNKVVRMFLNHTDAEWLWMLDSDMVFPPDTLARLLDVADPEESPIVGGLCFGQRTTEGRVEYFTTMFSRVDGDIYRLETWPEDTLLTVAATGTACLLVHRSVFEALKELYPEPLPWFAEEVNEQGGLHSEDVTFCFRAAKAGFPVKVHTGVKIGHVKPRVIDDQTYLEWWRAANGE